MAKVGMGMWYGKCKMVFTGHDVSGSMLAWICMTAHLCLPSSMSSAKELKADHHDTVQFKHNLGRENK